MGWIEKPNVDTTVNMPNGLPTFPKISSFVKNIIKSAQFYFHESEAFEVREVFLYTHEDRRRYERTGFQRANWVPNSATTVTPEFIGSVNGTFINNPDQEIKGGYVKPVNSEKAHYPVVGEHVSVIEYNGQHYYKEIINLKNSPNENAAPGATAGYIPNTKFGETFEKLDIRRVKVCEGEIVYEGRFGNSIKLGCNHNDNSPIIKIRAGQPALDNDIKNLSRERVNESIDNDASSIYLISNGLPATELFNDERWFDLPTKSSNKGEQIKGKKILIKSDGIFISGRDNIRLISVNNLNLKSEKINLNSDEVNLGNDANESVVKGDELKKIIDMLLDSAIGSKTAEAAVQTSLGNLLGAAQLTTEATELQAIKSLPAAPYLSTKVKTG